MSIVTSVRMINCDNDASIVIRALCLSSVSLFQVNCSHAHFAKVLYRLDLQDSPNGALLHIRATKTIQFFQRVLSIPLPIIPGLHLCPVMALIYHLRLNLVGPSDSLFSVRSPSAQSMQPITYYHFSKFLAKVITALGLDSTCLFSTQFSPWRRFVCLCM